MKKIYFLTVPLFLFLMSIFVLPSKYNKNKDESLMLKETNYKNEEETSDDTTTRFINFSFGEETIVSNNIYTFSIIDNYDSIPIINVDGNIDFRLIDSYINYNEVEISLPNVEGNLRITFVYENATIIKNIYSSKGEGNQYGISLLSIYSARQLVGNNDFSDEREPENLRFSGAVYGYLYWTDDNNGVHPLIGVMVEIALNQFNYSTYAYTDSLGYFYVSYSYGGNVSYTTCTLYIRAQNNMVKIIDASGYVACYTDYFQVNNGSSYNYGSYTFSESQNFGLGNAMQIFSAMYNYSNYAKELNGGNDIPLCKVYYQYSSESYAYYSNNSGYGNNSFIYANLSSNTTYVLIVMVYPANTSGQTKLTIIPTDGVFTNTSSPEFEDIYHVSSSSNYYYYSSYVNQYYSTIITWTPSTSGYYHINLSSNFDSFLYVLNPTSVGSIIVNVDYNDDEYYYDDEDYTLDGGLYQYYSSDVTYLIIYTQLNPSNSISNNSINVEFSI